jgi:hypothetical protein
MTIGLSLSEICIGSNSVHGHQLDKIWLFWQLWEHSITTTSLHHSLHQPHLHAYMKKTN